MDLKEVDYKKAVAVVRDCSSGSVSNIQRKLSWGYALAASAIDRMQAEFIVSPMSASGRRDVYPEEIHELWRELQKAKNSAVNDSMVSVPKALSDEKAHELAMVKWELNFDIFKSLNPGLTLSEVDEYRVRWCKNKARHFQQEYQFLIEAQGQNHE